MLVRRAALVLAALLALAGIALRASELGTYGFWNDEAWVALCTRVQGFQQFWLSLSVTPVLWAVTLKVWSLFGSGEGWFRGVPFVASVLGLWAAYRIGRDLVGHPAGGLLPLAVLGVDVHSLALGKVLKQYSAEALAALLAFEWAARFARTGERRALLVLVAVLAVGIGFANAEVFVGPPLVGALLVVTLARGDRRRAAWAAVAGVAVGLWYLVCYRFLIAPRVLPSVQSYFAGKYAPAGSLPAALAAVWQALERYLAMTWGPPLLAPALLLVGAVALLAGAGPVEAIALAGVVAEVTLMSSWQRFPIGEPRVLLFLLTLLTVYAAAAVGPAVAWAWRRASLRPVAVAALAFAALVFVRQRSWIGLSSAHQVEDLGPLIRRVEAERRPGEPVLLYYRSGYVYAYYQRRTPVLFPNPSVSVGYIPILDDPDVTIIDAAHAQVVADAAFAKHTRVWFLGSRIRADDWQRISPTLKRPGWQLEELPRQNALALRLWQSPTPAPEH